MRRILLLITDLEIGGTPTVVRELAVRLNDPPSVEVDVACLAGWGPVADQIWEAGLRVTPLDARGTWDIAVARRLLELIRLHHIDTVYSFLVHANAIAAGASPFARGVRFFQSIQTTQPRPRWHWPVQAIAQHRAEKVIVPSESVATAARKWACVPDRKIVVIPNALDLAEFQSVPRRPQEGRFSVGFIGRLDPVKRVPDLLQAVSHLNGLVDLHVFGDGPERQRIEQEIRRLGLSSLVTLHGSVSRPQDALATIDLLVLPSAAEGFGLVLIEAMAAGIPVVATEAAGIRDVVRSGETGLLAPVGSPAALAEAIRRVATDASLRAALVEKGAAEVERRFTWQVVLPRYRQILGLDEHLDDVTPSRV